MSYDLKLPYGGYGHERVNAVAWAHSLADLAPPYHHQLVQASEATLERLKGHYQNKLLKRPQRDGEDTMTKPMYQILLA